MRILIFVSTLALNVTSFASGLPSGCGIALGDYSQSQVYSVHSIVTPTSIEELQHLVRTTNRPLAVRGAGFSMGGQTASSNGVVVEMKGLNKIVELNTPEKTVRVQAGASWRQIQEAIDPYNLSVGVMQSYNNFQVGGSLSVNAHGRYVGQGPLIPTVLEVKVLLADGSIVTASRTERPDLFSAVIGGYAALGIITEAKLQLVENTKIERRVRSYNNGNIAVAARQAIDDFNRDIRGNPNAVFWNADIYPTRYNQVDSIAYLSTEKPVTNPMRMQPPAATGGLGVLWESAKMSAEQLSTRIKDLRAKSVAPKELSQPKVVLRNNEASYDNRTLMPLNDRLPVLRNPLLRQLFPFLNRKALLQEYFIPTAQVPEFLARLTNIFIAHKVNVSNISLRHVPANNESMLSWSKEESIAVVIYYTQTYGNAREANLGEAKEWTRKVIAEVEATGGSFYLPYQIYATRDQFNNAYPNSQKFFALKREYDPNNKFNNSLWETYNLSEDTYFYRDLLAAPSGKSELEKYFTNIFSLHDPQKFLRAIDIAVANIQAAKRDLNDRNVYEELLKVFPQFAAGKFETLKKTVSALRKQQNEMADQTAAVLKEVGVSGVTNYVEIGSPGRYIHPLNHRIRIRGEKYVIADHFGAADLVETSYGASIPAVLTSQKISLGNYDMIHQSDIPNNSVGLSTMFIGLHHCPPEQLPAFVASIQRMTKPGGYFVLRDHDANEHLLSMAFLAHSTYNAGLGVPYGGELNEVRNLHPLTYWISILERAGFKFLGKKILQAGDPTGNTLMVFQKEEPTPDVIGRQRQALAGEKDLKQLSLLPGFHRAESNTYMTQPEWLAVDMFAELAQFMRHSPWYEFPFDGFLALFDQVHQKHREFVIHQGIKDQKGFESYDQMDKQLYLGNWLLFKAVKFSANRSRPSKETPEARANLVASQWFLADFFKGYAEFMTREPWYKFPHRATIKQYEDRLWEMGSLSNMASKSLDEQLLRHAKVLFRAMDLFGGLTTWTLRNNVVDPNTQFLVSANRVELGQLPATDAQELQDLGDDLHLMQVGRYLPFTKVMTDLASTKAKVVSVAGNEYISVIVSSSQQKLPTLNVPFDLIMTYQYPTSTLNFGNKNYFHTVRVKVTELPKFLVQAQASGVTVLRVHDY